MSQGSAVRRFSATIADGKGEWLECSRVLVLDTRTGVVLVYVSTAIRFAIFPLRGAVEAIPVGLEEAAVVDGGTRFHAFVQVVLPAARPRSP